MEEIITTKYTQTRKAGQMFAKHLHGGEVIALHGDLGSGKTTFMQGLARGLGITRNILSPTFIIMRSYETTHDKKIMTLFHADLYRIETEADVKGLGLVELFGQPQTIVAIEWSEKIASLLPQTAKHIYFTYFEETKRKIRYG